MKQKVKKLKEMSKKEIEKLLKMAYNEIDEWYKFINQLSAELRKSK